MTFFRLKLDRFRAVVGLVVLLSVAGVAVLLWYRAGERPVNGDSSNEQRISLKTINLGLPVQMVRGSSAQGIYLAVPEAAETVFSIELGTEEVLERFKLVDPAGKTVDAQQMAVGKNSIFLVDTRGRLLKFSLDRYAPQEEVLAEAASTDPIFVAEDGKVILADQNTGKLKIYDDSNLLKLGEIRVSGTPYWFANAGKASRIYVANKREGSLSVVSLINFSEIYSVGGYSKLLRVEKLTGKEVVALLDAQPARLILFDEVTFTRQKTISLNSNPLDMVWVEQLNALLVLSDGGKVLEFVDPETGKVTRDLQLVSAFVSKDGYDQIEFSAEKEKILLVDKQAGKLGLLSLRNLE